MPNLIELAELEGDAEMVPEILPVDVRLSISGDARVLREMVDSAVHVAATKEIIANTSYIQVTAKDDEPSLVSVAATDSFRSIVKTSRALTVHLAGKALFPGKKLSDILKLVDDATVRLDVFSTSATIRAGRAVWSVQLPGADSLPPFPELKGLELYEVDAKTFRTALSQSQWATAKSSARISLTQVRISKGFVTGCDGSRVHKKYIGTPKSMETTVPAPFVATLISELGSYSGETFVFGATGSTVIARLGSDVIMGQKLSLPYPDVDHLMLEPALLNTEKLTVGVTELADVIKRVRVNADPDVAAVTLALRKIKGDWTLLVQATDKVGNASQEILEATYDGEKGREETVNYKHLLEFLSCLSEDSVTFKLGESSKTKTSSLYASEENFEGTIAPMAPGF